MLKRLVSNVPLSLHSCLCVIISIKRKQEVISDCNGKTWDCLLFSLFDFAQTETCVVKINNKRKIPAHCTVFFFFFGREIALCGLFNVIFAQWGVYNFAMNITYSTIFFTISFIGIYFHMNSQLSHFYFTPLKSIRSFDFKR